MGQYKPIVEKLEKQATNIAKTTMAGKGKYGKYGKQAGKMTVNSVKQKMRQTAADFAKQVENPVLKQTIRKLTSDGMGQFNELTKGAKGKQNVLAAGKRLLNQNKRQIQQQVNKQIQEGAKQF